MDSSNLGVGSFQDLTHDEDADFDGVTGSETLSAEDDVVAVKVGENWYKAEDVKSDGETTPSLVVSNGARALNITESEDGGVTTYSTSSGIDISSQGSASSAIVCLNSKIAVYS